jgi:hypothetical protein
MAVRIPGPAATSGPEPPPGGPSCTRPSAGRTPADLLRLTAAVLGVGAGAIHLLEAPAHYRQAAVYGRFFLVVAAAQLASGLLLALRRWPRPAYALAAYGYLAVAGVWAATRTVGIPLGPEAGERPPVASADLAATLLETTAALALSGVALAGRTRWTARLEHGRVGGRRLAAWLAALGLTVAGTVAGTVGPQRPLCEVHTSTAESGPLAAVDRHSLLPRTTPPVTLQVGRPASVLAGYLVNCASRPVTLEGVEVLNTTGTAARPTSFSIGPTTGGVAPVVAGDRDPPPAGKDRRPADGAVVAPSWRRPALALYADLEPVQPGHFAISAVRITVRDRDRSRTQPFATIVQVRVTRPTR